MAEKDPRHDLGPALSKLSVGLPSYGNPDVPRPPLLPPITASHTPLSGDIQARLLAFQQKRTQRPPPSSADLNPPLTQAPHASQSGPDITYHDKSLGPSKPLPPLPNHRSLSSNDTANRSLIPSPMPDSSRNALLQQHQAAQDLFSPSQLSPPTPLSPQKQNQVLHQPIDLAKKPSLSQRRGMKLNVSELTGLTSSNTSSPGTNQSLGQGQPQPPVQYAERLNTTGGLSRRLSERKKKPNFKLNLSEVDQANSPLGNSLLSAASSAVSSLSSSTNSSLTNLDAPQAFAPQDAAQGSSKKPQLHGLFANYSKYVDIKSGSLNFAGKASLHSKGVNFLSGSSFHISLEELEFLEELGHGNYGTVSKVLHKPTGVLMAMKEVRLELDENKFTQILMELEILHKCDSPYIVDFYGAFFVEGAVYMCIEHMDGGSLDKIYGKDEGVQDEACLAYITECVIRGLKELKDEHNIIHRDVKPTNILINTAGKVKLCDFGVSGNLVASLAKTNIGCQSYMAPERIKLLSPDDATYSIQADIWLLGLSILEIACGHYPYPPETYDNIFSQLSAIVDGEPPRLDPKIFSKEAQQFVKSCLNKNPDLRPSYDTLLKHPWLVNLRDVETHISDVVKERVKRYEERTSMSRSNSTKSQASVPPKAAPLPANSAVTGKPSARENVRSLLKGKVNAPALHRGGLPHANRGFSKN